MSEQEAVPEIPEDLKQLHINAVETCNRLEADPTSIKTVDPVIAFRVKAMIERIAALEAELAELRATDHRVQMEETADATAMRNKYEALEKERDALLLRECRHGAEVWKQVCASEVFQELKRGKYRDILDLLADGCISVGKAAQSIAERAGGVEPLLPEYQPMACDHPPSLMLKSAETGEPLYCAMCNTINERDDALKMEAVYKAENADLKQQVADGDLAFNHANEVVAALEAQVARLSWQPITPETTFDKSFDYLLGRQLRSCSIINGSEFQRPAASRHLLNIGWTHFRPINPPVIASRTTPENEEDAPDACEGCDKPLREDEGHETEDMVILCDECWQELLDDLGWHSEECPCNTCIAPPPRDKGVNLTLLCPFNGN